MSLFRIAVVLSLGIAVMPSDREQQARLYDQAATAAHWTVTFCDRNGSTCEHAGVAWTAFVKKAEFAGQLAYDMALRYAAGEAAGEKAPVSLTSGRGTLEESDLKPSWRGREPRQGI